LEGLKNTATQAAVLEVRIPEVSEAGVRRRDCRAQRVATQVKECQIL